ncbi:beta-ketoacyl synthase N-terminal-like domain-containing protein [Ascidiimonas aurantiaca]|uniref:beta-ketoacyl synthase N-terminal-like domain-containing protein n=1 Tax=Ascidiimonas aurantiaca TaxID=1685432 RepID=UPI0030EC4529
MRLKIAVTGLGSVSPLGTSFEEVYTSYKGSQHAIVSKEMQGENALMAPLSKADSVKIKGLREADTKYRFLDNTVLYAMYASRVALENAGWEKETEFGINIGSSRGATSLFEKYYSEFLNKGKSSTLSSPTTTLGNISSWVANDLGARGPEISHSITCSTALHAVLNGVAWLQSGMANRFLVGGSEASLTPFTISQMKALKIYANEMDEYPCRALDLKKNTNTMVLGEGAAAICLESGEKSNALAYIEGVGYATEPLQHNISISAEAVCFQKSMKMALGSINENKIDVIIMHAPGTIKGDLSEFKAIEKIFKDRLPALTTNKWKIGHTFGASGVLSIEMAIQMMKNQEFFEVPYLTSQKAPDSIKKVLVNAVGFGGNAVSVLLTLP